MSSLHESLQALSGGSPSYGHSYSPQRPRSNTTANAAQISKSSSNNSGSNNSSNNNNNNNTNTSNGQQAQQFCLRWNNYQTNLTSVFDQLLQSESFVDVTLACDGHSIKAHKMVLSACSPYFQTLFFDNPCQHPIIIMRDIKWAELKAAVEFMYKGEINVSQEQIGPLLKVAEMLKIRGLAEVNSDQELTAEIPEIATTGYMPERDREDPNSGAKKPRMSKNECQESAETQSTVTSIPKMRKRRWPSGDCSSSVESPSNSVQENMEPPSPLPPGAMPTQNTAAISPAFPGTPTQLDAVGAIPIGHDDMEIKPGIAEMIREEERVSNDFLLLVKKLKFNRFRSSVPF